MCVRCRKRALYVAPYTEPVEVVLKVPEVVLYLLEVVNGVRMCAEGHALHADVYSGGRGERAPFA